MKLRSLDVIVDDSNGWRYCSIPDFKSAENVYELFWSFKIPKVIIREV